MQLEKTAQCLVCRSDAVRPAHVVAGHEIWRCGRCGFQFVHPTPSLEELAAYYDRGYAVPMERYATNTARNEGRIANLERWRQRRGRLLEIGSSYGHSLDLARQRGWEVAGVELSPTAASYASEHFGLEVWNGDLLAVPFAPASFDAVIAWHVLEHTQDPQAQLDHVFRLLKPGGVVGIRVPNINSLGYRLAGRSWPWICPPAHLWYFSPATLSRLLARLGFEVLEVATLRGDGGNPYQHAIIGAGGRLNALRRRLKRAPASRNTGAEAPVTLQAAPMAPAVIQRWARLLQRLQPATDTLARRTSWIVTPLETHGWGDELLCYARRPQA